MSILHTTSDLVLASHENLLSSWLRVKHTRRRCGKKIMALYRGSAKTVTAEKTVDAAGKLAALNGLSTEAGLLGC